jgi:hypothetical protein
VTFTAPAGNAIDACRGSARPLPVAPRLVGIVHSQPVGRSSVKRGEAEPLARVRVAAGTSRVVYEEPKPRPRAAGTVEYMEIAVEEADS